MNQNHFERDLFHITYVHLMNLMYIFHLVKTWLKSFVQLPRTSSYVLGVENKTFADDAFMNFATDIRTYIISLTLVGDRKSVV